MTDGFSSLLVVEDGRDEAGPSAELLRRSAIREKTVERFRGAPDADDEDRAAQIARAAASLEDCLVVCPGERSPASTGPLIGGFEKALVRQCPAPLFIGREGHAQGTVAAAIEAPGDEAGELDAFNRDLVAHAAELAALLGQRTVLLLHVLASGGTELLQNPRIGLSHRERQHAMRNWEAERRSWLGRTALAASERHWRRGVTFEPVLRTGPVNRVLTDAVALMEIGTFCLGSANRTGLGGAFLGNTAEALLHRAPCSLLVSKPAATARMLREAALRG